LVATGTDEESISCEGGVFLFLGVWRRWEQWGRTKGALPVRAVFFSFLKCAATHPSGCAFGAGVSARLVSWGRGNLLLPDSLWTCSTVAAASDPTHVHAASVSPCAWRVAKEGSDLRNAHSKSQQFTTAHNSESKIAVTVVPSQSAIQGPPRSQFIFTAGSQHAVTCCELFSVPNNLWRRSKHRGGCCTCHVSRNPLNLESGAVRGPPSCGRFTAPRHPPARPPRLS